MADRLISFEITGIKDFKNNKVFIDLTNQKYAKSNDGELQHLISSLYVHNVVAFTGINASGKTMILRLIDWIIRFFSGRFTRLESLFDIADFESNSIINALFYNSVDKKMTSFTLELFYDNENIKIISETIKIKKIASSFSKKAIFNFDNNYTYLTREIFQKDFINFFEDKNRNLIKLQDNVSIVNYLPFLKEVTVSFYKINRIGKVSMRQAPLDINPIIIKYFDPSIEYLERVKTDHIQPTERLYKLKFVNREEITVSELQLTNYLSTGTIKGLELYSMIIRALQKGGYVLIDEIEISLHKTLVIDIIKLFNSNKTNPHGAILILSTHYSELLDSIRRTDAILVCTKTNDGDLNIENLSNLIPRNDLNKSTAYLSNLLGVPSSPSFRRYQDIVKDIINKVN